VTRFSLAHAEQRYADCARALGCADASTPDTEAGHLLVEALEKLNADLGVPTPSGYGIAESEWTARLPVMAEQALASGSPANNPRVPTLDEVVALYQEIYR